MSRPLAKERREIARHFQYGYGIEHLAECFHRTPAEIEAVLRVALWPKKRRAGPRGRRS